MRDWLISTDAARAAVAADPQNRRNPKLMRHGSMSVEIYALREHDPQRPHEQDELYIVIAGSGTFLNGTERRPFRPGDLIFVAAGVPHGFEDFTSDFEAWVVFWGPEGGEKG